MQDQIDELRERDWPEVVQQVWDELTGVKSNEQGYLILLGIYWGKLMWTQERKAKVNLASNALSFLREPRITLDLTHKIFNYCKTKFLQYKTAHNTFEPSKIAESIARLAGSIKKLSLNNDETAFYLLLGVSLTYRYKSTKEDNDEQSTE